MDRLRRYVEQLGQLLVGMSNTARILSAVMLLLVAAGGMWLAMESSEGLVPAFDRKVDHSELAELRRKLSDAGIEHDISAGRLVVPADSRQAAGRMLDEIRLSGSGSMAAMRKLAAKDDIWQSQAAANRKWQVAKMDLLSEMIADLPQIHSAHVLLDSRSNRKFGTPSVQTSAVVKVQLAERSRMTPRLVSAIAEMVCGSVAGMGRSDVRIVDDTGTPYRAVDYSAAGPAEILMQSERYYEQRIRSALAFVDELAVTVTLSPAAGGKMPLCHTADVSVPRSCVRTAIATAKAGDAAGLIERKLADLHHRVMAATGISEPSSVRVRMHDDPAVLPAGTSEARPHVQTAQWQMAIWGVPAVLMLCAAAARLMWLGVRSRRGTGGTSTAGQSGQQAEAAAQGTDTFGFLGDLSGKQLAGLLAREHPQAVALVLSQMGPGKSAAVLAAMAPERQVEIVRRMASLGADDAELAREVSAGLADKLASQGADAANMPAEMMSLDDGEYSGDIPAGEAGPMASVDELFGGGVFDFEDIVDLPPDWLREGLAKVQADEIAVALRATGAEVQERVLQALSPEQSRRVAQEMDSIGPVRLSDVEAAQLRLTSLVRAAGGFSYVSDQAQVGSELAAFGEEN